MILKNGHRIDNPGQQIQYNVMPIPSVDEAGHIIQYVGETTAQYINGYFYKCVLKDGTYKWEAVISGGGSEIDCDDTTIKKNSEDKIYVNIDNETIVYDSENDYIKAIGGSVEDVQINGTSIVSNKIANIESGVNIKTINNQSVLGSGNIEISGGTKVYTGSALPSDSVGNDGDIFFIVS